MQPRHAPRRSRVRRVSFRRCAVPCGAALFTLAWCAPAAVQGQRDELDRHIQRRVLANGLEVIVVENEGVPLVTIEADVRNGSFTQEPAFEGLSHLYEHMFFKANATYPIPDEFVSRAAELGAVFNGTTSEERVNYYLTLPADSVEGGMHFLGAALREPLFRQDELERERAVVIGEYDRNEASPLYRFTRAVDQVLWSSACSRKNPLGERDVILRTTPEQMRQIQRRYYVPNNTAVIVTGAVAAARAFALVTDVFGDWVRAPDPFVVDPIPPIPPLDGNKGVIVEEPLGGTAVITMKWQGPSARRDPASTYAADVFSDVLNLPGSRFQHRLVDSGLFQSLGVNYYTLNQVGPITIFGETNADRVKEALAALNDELRRVGEPGYFTADELAGIKQQRIVGTMMSMERASGFAHQLGFWWAVTGLDYFFGYVDTMARQTPADLQHYFRRYIAGKPHVTGVLLAPEARRALRLTTAALAATEYE